VVDTGIGIAQERLDALCEPFVQADASTSRRFGGTGLGLAIARKLSEMMGGRLEIASKVGVGSIFSVTIPTGPLEGVKMLSNCQEALAEHERAPASLPRDALSGLKILLAEDGPDNQRLIRAVLTKAGAEVAIAENGLMAVERAVAGPFDLVLMDIQMPLMDGYEATRKLRAAGFAPPIIALTAHAMASDRDRCLVCGCTAYLSKPVKRRTLLEAVLLHAKRAALPAPPPPACRPDDPQGAVRSELADDPDFAEIIAEFVAGLDDKVRAMRGALAHGMMDDLRKLAHQLKGAGGSYGYGGLTHAARLVEEAAKTNDWEASTLALAGLSELCGKIVLGQAAPPAGEQA